MALRPAQAQPWQLPNYGRDHGVVTEPGMPKCNMAVSEECRRLYGRAQRSPQHTARYNCAYKRSVALIRARDPRQMRIAAKDRAGLRASSSLEDPDNRSVVAELIRHCAARGQ
jgi:hypothetical protein